jgi:hypothetical protein
VHTQHLPASLLFSLSSFSLSPSPAAHPTLPRKIPQQTKPTSRKINLTKSNQTNQKKEEEKKKEIKRELGVQILERRGRGGREEKKKKEEEKRRRGSWACR